MKQLQDILYKSGIVEKYGHEDVQIEGIAFDSRLVEKNFLFVAVKGYAADGHQFIAQAIEKGAAAVVCEELPNVQDNRCVYVVVKNSAIALGHIASNFYDQPSEKLKLVGVTGTNGKTTIATLLHKLMRDMKINAGLLSTICNKINDLDYPTTHTTPDPVQLNSLLHEMVAHGCEYCFMEVSSHAVHQHRIAGLSFVGGIFTNLTHDHLDYHKTFEEYLAAKQAFFTALPAKAFALVNIDDRNGKVMAQNSKAIIKSYALKNMADYKARIVENSFAGLQLHVDATDVWCRLIGDFNAYNLLAIYGTARLLGFDKETVLSCLSNLQPADGRFEFVKTDDNITAIVDYAHTPDALKNVLDTIHAIRKGNEQLITVVGCGGDRDRTKRPIMAKIAGQKSDKVILTSDNPRTEDPQAIIDEMLTGVDVVMKRKVMTIVNRKEAIRTACAFANPGDIILIAGKGHEKYQDIHGVKHPFDDKQIVAELLFNK